MLLPRAQQPYLPACSPHCRWYSLDFKKNPVDMYNFVIKNIYIYFKANPVTVSEVNNTSTTVEITELDQSVCKAFDQDSSSSQPIQQESSIYRYEDSKNLFSHSIPTPN